MLQKASYDLDFTEDTYLDDLDSYPVGLNNISTYSLSLTGNNGISSWNRLLSIDLNSNSAPLPLNNSYSIFKLTRPKER